MKDSSKTLQKILNIYINKENPYIFTSEELENAKILANKLEIGSIVAYTIEKYKLSNNPDLSFLYNIASNQERQNVYRNKIKEILETNNINFLFLKGNTLASYYEQEYLRYSCDIDLIVEENNFEKTKELLIKELNIKDVYGSKNELSLVNSKVAIDLHSMFTHNDLEKEKVFNDVDYTNKNHELDNNYKYIFLIYHTYMHIVTTCLSLKSLLDIYYVSKLELDHKFIDEKLNELKLKTFETKTINLINVLFNNYEFDEETSRYYNFLINYSNLRGVENKTIIGVIKNDRPSKNLINRAFPDINEMKRLYPELNKNKILLPFYYVKRIIDRTSQGRGKLALEEINANMNLDSKKIEETKILLKDLGINE